VAVQEVTSLTLRLTERMPWTALTALKRAGRTAELEERLVQVEESNQALAFLAVVQAQAY
jgi:hypothetical protein